jgi:hypothetical protein
MPDDLLDRRRDRGGQLLLPPDRGVVLVVKGVPQQAYVPNRRGAGSCFAAHGSGGVAAVQPPPAAVRAMYLYLRCTLTHHRWIHPLRHVCLCGHPSVTLVHAMWLCDAMSAACLRRLW